MPTRPSVMAAVAAILFAVLLSVGMFVTQSGLAAAGDSLAAEGWQLWQQPFELLSATWRCISYDHRGSGETVAPIESITAETLVADLFAVLDSLGVGRCVLAGESMGGLVAMAAARAEPERFEGLVLVSSPVPGQRGAERLIAGSRIDYAATATAFARASVASRSPSRDRRPRRSASCSSRGNSGEKVSFSNGRTATVRTWDGSPPPAKP